MSWHFESKYFQFEVNLTLKRNLQLVTYDLSYSRLVSSQHQQQYQKFGFVSFHGVQANAYFHMIFVHPQGLFGEPAEFKISIIVLSYLSINLNNNLLKELRLVVGWWRCFGLNGWYQHEGYCWG